MTTQKNFSYTDEKIIIKGRVFYLRVKKGLRHNNDIFLTIRTKQGGKGSAIAKVKGVIYGETHYIKLLHKLHRKVKFQFLRVQEIPPIPEEEKEN